MLRNIFALTVVLAMAASTQAAMMLQASAPVAVPATATSSGLVQYTISAVSNAGEIINSIADPTLSIVALGSSMGVHQVFQALTTGQTPTRQDQIAGTPNLWDDGWRPYDTYFFFTAANSLKFGTGNITETRTPPGATLPQGAALGAANTGFGTISTVGGAGTYSFTVPSGIPGTNVPFLQVVQKATDANLLVATLINDAGGTSQQQLQIGPGTVIPEPTTVALLGLAFAGCFGFIRRR
jgi:hypothetical protein